MEEERLNRVKNWMGFPTMAFDYVLKHVIKDISKVDRVALCNIRYQVQNRDKFYKGYDEKYLLSRELLLNNSTTAKDKSKTTFRSVLAKTPLKSLYRSINPVKEEPDLDTDYIVSKGFPREKICRVEHHLCHAAAVYYGLVKDVNEKYLVFTLDGGGDQFRDTVSIAQGGKIERVGGSYNFSVGNLYSGLTYHLGFTPHEHEYKLMGLAPYANKKYAGKYKDMFYKYLNLANDDTEFVNPIPMNSADYFKYLQQDFSHCRFDNMAAGLQDFTEEIVIRWIKGNMKKHGINKILGSGGVFMNVKLNMLISKLPEVEFIDVFPSCGDESNIFGAAFYVFNEECERKVGLLDKYTLGIRAEDDLDAAISKYKDTLVIEKHDGINKWVASQLVDNKIVARCSGEMEFGARALGNRSIMANPSNMQNVNKINQAVKKRDFWMPFAPASTDELMYDAFVIPKSLKPHGSPYMMFAFDTNEAIKESVVCGIHQADNTARVETLNKERYPAFHEIVTEFHRLTGIPASLNTSFNLHGFPIVATTQEAIEVLLDSKIDILVVGDYSFRKKN